MVDLLSFMDKVTPRYMYYDQILYVCMYVLALTLLLSTWREVFGFFYPL